MTRILSCTLMAILIAGGIGSAAQASGKPVTTLEQKDGAPLGVAQQALEDFDYDRLWQDKAYAEAMLGHIDSLAPLAKDSRDAEMALLGARAITLAALRRADESRAAVRLILAGDVTEPDLLGMAWAAAADIGDPDLMLAAVERMAANVEPAERRTILPILDPEMISALYRNFHSKKEDSKRYRLAEALVVLEWPGLGRDAELDGERLIAIQGRMAKGDVGGAKALAGRVSSLYPLLPLVLARKFDPLFGPNIDRVALLRRAIAAEGASTQRLLQAEPSNFKNLLARAQYLRSVARSQEAVALLKPPTADLTAVEKGGEDAFWLTNQLALALIDLGRADEAVVEIEKLLTLGLDEHPTLINMAINLGEYLSAAGRYADAARHSERLFADAADGASDYGRMWMWSAAACGHALAGNRSAAEPWMQRLDGISSKNEAAHLRALLCASDLDAAERLLIRRLEGADSEQVLPKLQNYELAQTQNAIGRVIEERWAALKARPAVAAAIAKHGHLLTLPLAKTYWGDY